MLCCIVCLRKQSLFATMLHIWNQVRWGMFVCYQCQEVAHTGPYRGSHPSFWPNCSAPQGCRLETNGSTGLINTWDCQKPNILLGHTGGNGYRWTCMQQTWQGLQVLSSVQSHSLSSIHYCRHTMQHFCSQLSDVSTFSKEAKIVLLVISLNDNVIVKLHSASQSVTKSPFNRENQGKHWTLDFSQFEWRLGRDYRRESICYNWSFRRKPYPRLLWDAKAIFTAGKQGTIVVVDSYCGRVMVVLWANFMGR